MQLILWPKQKLSSIITVCVVMIVVIVCLRLAYWQLQRADNKTQQLAHIAKLQSQGVMTWQQMLNLPSRWNKTGLQVSVSGTLNTQQYWLLDNQVYQGQVGYDVLALLTLANSQETILVNLGWVKAPATRAELPSVLLPNSLRPTTIQLKQGKLSGFTLQNEQTPTNQGWPKRVQTIDLALFTKQSGHTMASLLGYRQGAGDEIATPHYQAVVMSPQKHHAYAVQWLLIGVACVAVALFASKKKELK